MRQPNFDANIKKVLLKQKPEQASLFDFIISEQAEEYLSDYTMKDDSLEEHIKRRIKAFYNGGYDFVPFMPSSSFHFERKSHADSQGESYSLNDGAIIVDEESFEKYQWPDMNNVRYDVLEIAQKYLPDGMKILSFCPDGILENVIGLCGYENLCYMLMDDKDLVRRIFHEVGTRLQQYQIGTLEYENVGITFCNDDWGFKNSTMISYDDLRELVYPYYTKIAQETHKVGKVIAMHSCGNFGELYPELYNVIGFDGKHSNEDTILPVETAYERYGGKIAILGGIDIDFLCRASQKDIEYRCKHMLELSQDQGGYALGSGNSIARYVPMESYITLIQAANPDFQKR